MVAACGVNLGSFFNLESPETSLIRLAGRLLYCPRKPAHRGRVSGRLIRAQPRIEGRKCSWNNLVREATGRRTAAVSRITAAGKSSRISQDAASIVSVQTFVKSSQSFTFDLTHALASQSEGFTDFLQSLWFTVIETEPHFQDGGFPGIHFVQQS
jgi:hypothetical protein